MSVENFIAAFVLFITHQVCAIIIVALSFSIFTDRNCFIQPVKEQKNWRPSRLIVFDLETCQDIEMTKPGIHTYILFYRENVFEYI